MDTLLELSHSLWINLPNEQFLFTTGFGHYLLLATLVAIEGPVVTLLGAAAASAGIMQPGWVFFAAACGNMTADILWYSLGYLGKIEWALRYGGWMGLRKYHLDRMEQHINEHAGKMILLAKL